MRWLFTLIVVSAAGPLLFGQGTGPRISESVSHLTLSTGRYEVEIGRDGFELTIGRNGETVFESARNGDALPNLGFTVQGVAYRPARLESYREDAGTIALTYQTTLKDATARVELRPDEDRIRIRTYLLRIEGDLAPSVRYRLAPSGLWYGGGFQGFRDPQTFPLNQARIGPKAFLAAGNTQGTPVWYSTKGVAVWIKTKHDFVYSVNGGPAGPANGLFNAEMPAGSSLEYEILLAPNVRDIVRRVVADIGRPASTPPAEYFRLPIYTTWVEHKVGVSQQKVLEYARAIRRNELPAGLIEIDDKWESRYGDMEFDREKFPDAKSMNVELHRLGFRVTLWVHPFVNVDSQTFQTSGSLLMKDASEHPGLIKWWNGDAAIWDFTNPDAAGEFRARLDRLRKEYGFDGFKFDGGDVNFVPRDLRAHRQITAAEYADVYNREAAAYFPWEETRVGVYSQPLGVVQRLIDKQSVWGKENGLAATLPEAIAVSLRGFPYVMPDMVGGNQYDGDTIEKELLIRWAQASALMPLLQFSVGAWHFDEETVRLVREASQLHVRFAPYIVKLAGAAPQTGEPILRPVWYNFPEDREALPLVDEFMLGDAVLVAPVLQKGATTRSVYLPAGQWKDFRNGEILAGGRWLKSYAAPLDTLPIFIRNGAESELALDGAPNRK
jgi:alpha-glucosidase (family GH31 glycosyl hydrolase)